MTFFNKLLQVSKFLSGDACNHKIGQKVSSCSACIKKPFMADIPGVQKSNFRYWSVTNTSSIYAAIKKKNSIVITQEIYVFTWFTIV